MELLVSNQRYRIGEKNFILKTDFTYKELDWLDVVMERLEARSEKQEVRGKFTRDEIEKTLQMILTVTPPSSSPYQGEERGGVTHEDFLKCTEGLSVKIIADFFLQRAVLGVITSGSLMN